MRIAPAPLVPEIRLYGAHPASGLARLAEAGAPPYWAYHWAGGAVLARHFIDSRETVRDRRILDLGAGCGIVGIAAMLAGARAVTASEVDPNALAALGLNATLNGVEIEVAEHDLLDGPPPSVDLVAAGDLFYDAHLADRVTGFLARCRLAGIDVRVGDPGRAFLPLEHLRLVAEYEVPDFGSAAKPSQRSGVFAFEADVASASAEPGRHA